MTEPIRRLVHDPSGKVSLAALTIGLVLVASSAIAAQWRGDRACGRVLPAPRPVTREGCGAASCVAGDGGIEVCACRPSGDAAGGVRFTVRAGGREQSWSAEPMLGDTGAFRVTLADLDGDGRDEVVVGMVDDVSNGMAVQFWSLCVVDVAGSTGPACTKVEDYPFLGMLTRAPGERRCRVLATHWLWGSEPRRVDGLYLVGRWLDYAAGKLTSDARRPRVARRYLYRFAAQRAAAVESARTAPILWWRDPTTFVVRCPDRLCEEGVARDP